MKILPRILIECLGCSIKFEVPKNSNRKFHNRECYQKEWIRRIPGWNKGTKGLIKANKGSFKKGNIPWHTGLKGVMHAWQKGKTKEDYPQLSNAGRKSGYVNEKLGTGGYSALHQWIKRQLGKPKICQQCGSNNNVQWANKSHEYKWELSDWIALCIPCHRKHDGHSEKMKRSWEKRRQAMEALK